ncbi:ATP-binding protein [Streptantibioticus rubrisoli]|uniref:ATP-binding protein n=1 Tax=Streptantibioticus rubrisoli TaxID=1387313 RepID=A0ABT1PF48_9ACTN|nr:ATP-binding protein [Streptantibioticus rubrisoli]MCQ4043987.1 ATP-binding protein [Streptantibioticus rubrisoli]
MSLPLKSRIARAAVLVAAAAPVIGMGASAAQAAEMPATNGLSGLSSPETIHNADAAVHKAAGVVNEAGSNTAHTVLPTATSAVSKTGKKAGPAANKLVGQANHAAGDVVGGTAKSATSNGLPTGSLPVGGADLPSLGG